MVPDQILYDRNGNDSKQDCWEVSNILDAVLSRVTLQIQSLRSVWVVTENARSYQTYFVSVISPFIYTAHGLNLNGFAQPETERRKSLVDAHFQLP